MVNKQLSGTNDITDNIKAQEYLQCRFCNTDIDLTIVSTS